MKIVTLIENESGKIQDLETEHGLAMYIEVDGKKLKCHTSENLDFLVYENQSYTNLNHRRSVFFVDKTFYVIVDEAIGSGTGDVKVRFQIKEGLAKYDFKNNIFSSDFINGPNVQVAAFSNEAVKTIEEDLKVSYSYREELPRKGVAYLMRKNDDQPVTMVSVVYPEEGTLSVLDSVCSITKESDGELSVQLSIKGKDYQLGYSL